MKILLGTYTKKTSKGIYQIELHEGKEKLENYQLLGEVENPTYLDFDQEEKRVYSVMQKGDQGGVGVWKYRGDRIELEQELLAVGKPPCYVSYDGDERLVYEANYHLGSVSVHAEDHLEKVFQYGEGSHAHFVDRDPKTHDLFVCDLGLDTIHKYRLLEEIATYHSKEGSGPRHIAFHPTKPYLYVFNELASTITVLEDQEFEFKHVQTISTLPEGIELKSGAAIRISNDGNYVYASNRGHDSLSVFSVSEKGRLKMIQNISTYGEHPRDFALSPDNHYCVVANLNTNNLTLYRRDSKTGLLEMIQKNVKANEPVCVHFI